MSGWSSSCSILLLFFDLYIIFFIHLGCIYRSSLCHSDKSVCCSGKDEQRNGSDKKFPSGFYFRDNEDYNSYKNGDNSECNEPSTDTLQGFSILVVDFKNRFHITKIVKKVHKSCVFGTRVEMSVVMNTSKDMKGLYFPTDLTLTTKPFVEYPIHLGLRFARLFLRLAGLFHRQRELLILRHKKGKEFIV